MFLVFIVELVICVTHVQELQIKMFVRLVWIKSKHVILELKGV